MAEANLKINAQGVESASAKLKELANSMGPGLNRAAQQAKSGFGGLVGGITAVKGAFAAAGGYAAYRGSKMLVGWSIDAANAARTMKQFEKMGGSQEQLNRIADSIGNVADDSDLARMAVMALRSNSKMTINDFGEIAKFARIAADEIGGDYMQSLQDVQAAIVTGRPVMLRRLGIMVDEDAAVRKAAAALKTHTKELNSNAKQQAISAAIMDEIRKKNKEAGPPARDAASSWAEAGAAWSRTREEIGKKVGPVSQVAAETITGALDPKKSMWDPQTKYMMWWMRQHPKIGGLLSNPVQKAITASEIAEPQRRYNELNRMGVLSPAIKVDKIVTRQAGGG